MGKIQTNLFIFFSSEGDKPTVVTQKLAMIGFVPNKGSVDYIYVWQKRPTLDELIALADRITEVLKGSKVSFNIETVEL